MSIFFPLSEESLENLDQGSIMIKGKKICYKATVKVQEWAVANVLTGGKLYLNSNRIWQKTWETSHIKSD